eukprot:COSAG02_NODE_28234_length_593_cov_1.127530_1_plen_122_part_00
MLSMEEKAGEWRTYMAELAQGTPAEEQRAQWPHLHDVSEADHQLGRDELEDVFRKIKYGKAVPTDGIAIEAYKASPVAKEALDVGICVSGFYKPEHSDASLHVLYVRVARSSYRGILHWLE